MSRRYMFRPKFHLSPIERITDIKHQGLLMDRCTAQYSRIWLCDWDVIPHIGQHLLKHHGFKLHRYAIFSVRHWLLDHGIRKCANGIYYYVGNVPPQFLDLEYSLWFQLGVDVVFADKGVRP